MDILNYIKPKLSFLEPTIENNVRKIYIFKFLKWFLISSPVSYLFYKENGISTTEIMTLHSIYSISMVILDLPLGYVADFIGRKKALIISSIFAFIAFFLYSLSSVFYEFVVVQLFLGLATSLASSTDSALLYDTLDELNKNKDYKENERNILSIESFSEATASILGGLVATINMRYNLYFETFFIFISIIL
ncbi:MAG: MFS transporter, partial [Candidatus Sericytochromatia bacterium]|nr:MFS transporter [Candidatus Sericytochromatia bacterium]